MEYEPVTNGLAHIHAKRPIEFPHIIVLEWRAYSDESASFWIDNPSELVPGIKSQGYSGLVMDYTGRNPYDKGYVPRLYVLHSKKVGIECAFVGVTFIPHGAIISGESFQHPEVVERNHPTIDAAVMDVVKRLGK